MEELQQRYKDASRITTGVIFGAGDRILGEYAREEVMRRQKVREEKDAVAANKKKTELNKRIKIEMSKQGFKLTICKTESQSSA
jgi:hypothetical protein